MTKSKFKSCPETTWSLLELAGLLEDEESHVHYGKIKKHVALHPYHLTNLSVALNEILHSSLNSYDSELQGFLLAYKNPKLLTAFGDTFYDSCFIHIDIEADFYVFRPQIGHTVKGIVNKKGYNHIGIVVHKAFNVSIPKTLDSEWPGDLIEIGQEVKFTITHIDLSSRLPFIRGTISRTNYSVGCKLLTKKTNKRKKTTANESFYERDNESDNSCDSNTECNNQTLSRSRKLKESEKQVSPEKRSKKKRSISDENIQDKEGKKRSKKRLKLSQELNHSAYKVENNVSSESSNDNANSVYNTDIDTSTKKKKRSEKSSKKKSLEGSQISESEFDCSTVKIKIEKDLTSNSDSENTAEIESRKREKKSKKQSKKLKYSDNTNGIIDNEEIQKDVKLEIQEDVRLERKRHSKKHKLPDSDIDDSKIEIKLEESAESNNIEYSLDKDYNDIVNRRRKSSEKRIKKTLTDSESEIDNIRIKKEQNTSESENTQGEDDRKDRISKIVKKEKSPSRSSHSRNENYLNGTPTKHKRKREKTPMVEGEFETVTIKEEKLDDYSFDYTSQSNRSSRKSKEIDIKSEPDEITIKVEEDEIKSEFKNDERTRERSVEGKRHKTSPKKRSRNESFKSYQSDCSTAEELEETKHNIFSPTKRSKKSKEPKYEILPGNAEVKIERSSSVESLKV